MLALFLAAAIATVPPSSPCAPMRVRLVNEAQWELPDDDAPTHKRIMFMLDLGSDGRVRTAQLVDSSGDPRVDAAARAAALKNQYAARTTGCVAWSGIFRAYWDLTGDELAPTPSVPTPPPAPLTDPCSTLVEPYHAFAPSHRVHAGTVGVDVDLDKLAAVRAVRVGATSGFSDTDAEALRLTRLALYSFIQRDGCPAHALTYRAELTFP